METLFFNPLVGIDVRTVVIFSLEKLKISVKFINKFNKQMLDLAISRTKNLIYLKELTINLSEINNIYNYLIPINNV